MAGKKWLLVGVSNVVHVLEVAQLQMTVGEDETSMLDT